MIKVSLTKNLAGATILGDYNDLDEIVNSLYTITIDEYGAKKNTKYIDMSTRVLGLAYDIRHALQGDRKIELIDNGMSKEIMKYHSTITSDKNVYYSCNYIFTEMVYCMIALNELIAIKTRGKKAVFNRAINVLRMLQTAFVECVAKVMTKTGYEKWIISMTRSDAKIFNMAHQYMDIVNIDYLYDLKDSRRQHINMYTKSIVDYQYDEDYIELKNDLIQYAKDNNCDINKLQFTEHEYPEEIEW